MTRVDDVWKARHIGHLPFVIFSFFVVVCVCVKVMTLCLNERIGAVVLGATGLVGQRLVSLLDEHPWFQVMAVAASPRSEGKLYKVQCRCSNGDGDRNGDGDGDDGGGRRCR